MTFLTDLQATVCSVARSKSVPMRSACLFAAGLVGASGLLVGCTASSEEVRPNPDELFFPTGAAVSPDDSILFVANANSELRFDSGSVGVVDLESVDVVSRDWMLNGTVPDGCGPDPDHAETLVCSEEAFMLASAAARIGNFATDIAVQDMGDGALRLIVPTRGDPSVAWLDWDGAQLSCGSGQGFAQCDEPHRLQFVHDDPELSGLPDEPFDAFADSAGQFAIVTHLTTGAVTLIDSPIGGAARVSDVLTGFFSADPSTGLRGATGVAGRTPTAADDIIYVASRTEDRIQTFTVGRPVNNADPYLLPGNFFFLNLVGANSGGSSDSRSLAFSASGDRLYIVNRRPPTLQVFDTSLTEAGVPRNMGIGATDICRQASTLSVLGDGDNERAYVTCFQDGQLYIVDPRGLSMVEDIISIGRGPYAVATAPSRKKVYVTNYLEDTIAVVDVAPDSIFHNRGVLRIGEVRPL